VVDTGTKFEDYDPKNPAYAAWRFYPSKAAWADGAIQTLRAGHFNTVGAWSDYSTLLSVPGNDLKMTPILHSGSSAGFPWTDMWDPKLVKVADDVTKGLIESLHRDPRIIGYFSDNELGWWRPAVFQWVWKQPTHYTRQRVIALLKARYKGSWAALSRDFDAGKVKSWKELQHKGSLCLRPGAAGQPAIAAVQRMLAERYYQLSRRLIKRYDPGALYLGDRYISNYYPEVANEAGKYCDVVSTNLNPNWGDGGFVRYHLQGLEQVTHKPLMVTEYYMSAEENRSGNKNDRSGFPVVKTLEERAKGFANTTEAFLRNPDLVGAHWFQYYDEPKDGRGDGENYNFGLVDVNNTPYAELLQASEDVLTSVAHGHAAPLPGEYGPIPKAPAEADDLTKWDRGAAYVAPKSKVPRGDCYVAWSPEGLELRLFWSEERFTENYYRNGKVPARDATTVQFTAPNGQARVCFAVTASGPVPSVWGVNSIRLESLKPSFWRAHAKYDTASWLSIRIPATMLGKAELHSGQNVSFGIVLTSQTKAYQTTWRINRKLS
jgi:hypothetical protein